MAFCINKLHPMDRRYPFSKRKGKKNDRRNVFTLAWVVQDPQRHKPPYVEAFSNMNGFKEETTLFIHRNFNSIMSLDKDGKHPSHERHLAA